MKLGKYLSALLILASIPCPRSRAESAALGVRADPAIIQLHGPGAAYSLLVQATSSEGQPIDCTRRARYRSLNPSIATVTAHGIVHTVADGTTQVIVEADGRTLTVPVHVTGASEPRRYNFENDIVPLLSKFGCNSSGCHGKAEGQNGFKLSVFGFDPPADFAALTMEARGRRIFPAAPEHSLVLLKASGAVPHGGGLRLKADSSEYETLRGWIAAGTPFGDASDPKVVSIRVEPSERLLPMRAQQQLRVIARYSDGREADVTWHARFQSNNEALASVTGTGLVTAGEAPGDVAIMAGFMNAVDVFRALIPRPGHMESYPQPTPNNVIDSLVFGKLRKLNLLPSEPVDDAAFLRRVYLDVIGTLPTADEAKQFLHDPSPDRRFRLVNDLMERPEFADYWALKWADLLRVDRQALGRKRAYNYYSWIRKSLAGNKPLDQFVRELVAADGPLDEVGPANFYKVVGRPGDEASTVAQVFMGVRLACAECHHHPFDCWSQTDYYGMQAFFTPVGLRGQAQGEALMASGAAQAKNPRTGETVTAHPLGMIAPRAAPNGDCRAALAQWLTAPDNPWFARNLANRTWAHFLGRGLVEPVDDVRATNPATNPELLDALASHLVEHHYDFRSLVRLITSSLVYQLSSRPNATNERDEQNYSRALFKRLDAEVLLDMVCQTTGVGEKFPGVPAGYRAVQLWDSHVPHYFLKLFGRPERISVCECERNHEPSVSQVLHLLNAPDIHAKLAHEAGFVARTVRLRKENATIVDEFYLTFYSRYPTEKEKRVALDYFARNPSERRQAAEDLAWSVMNSLEFVFNH